MPLSRRQLLVGLGSTVGLAACGSGPVSKVDWAGDLDGLVSGIESTHPNPWWREPRADFMARVATLKHTLPGMSKRAQEVAVMELVATIDGHSAIYPTELGWHFLGIQFYDFSGTTAVSAYPARPELVGATLETIGTVPLAEARRRLTPLASHDNDQTIRLMLPLTYVMPEALTVKGLVAKGAKPSYGLRTAQGESVTVTPESLEYDAYVASVGWDPAGLPPRDAPLVLTRRRDPIWWTTLPSGALYIVYNQVQSDSADVVAPVRDAAAHRRRPGVIVDLTNNPGGDNHTYVELLAALQDPRLRGRLVVIIGRTTFSAAMNFAVEVEQSTDAVFVGEATGARPNLYGDVRPVGMPSSGLTAYISSRYWPKAGDKDTRVAMDPDVPVEWTVVDFLAGRDPVLDAAVRVLR